MSDCQRAADVSVEAGTTAPAPAPAPLLADVAAAVVLTRLDGGMVGPIEGTAGVALLLLVLLLVLLAPLDAAAVICAC